MRRGSRRGLLPLRKPLLLSGCVRVQVSGEGRERFLNLVMRQGLSVNEVRAEGKEQALTFWTRSADFKRMKPAARKAGVRLRIAEKRGLPFFLYRNRRRKLFAAGLVGFFGLLYGISLFIWDISFEGNRRFTDAMLLHYMETLPVVCGMRKSKLSCEALEAALRDRFPEISWASAELTGTRLIVRIRENDAETEPALPEQTPRSLAAVKAGRIVRAVVRSGVLLVKAGDEVEAGTELVSGLLPIYDDSETLVNTHEIRADAEIYAETVISYEKTYPELRMEQVRTGRVRRGFLLEAFGNPVYLLPPDPGAVMECVRRFFPGTEGDWGQAADAGSPDAAASGWQFVTETAPLRLTPNFVLPFSVGTITGYEYEEVWKNNTEEEIAGFADELKKEYMEKLSEKGIQILGNDDKIEKTASGWRITGSFAAVEDIAREIPIPDTQEENQDLDEYHGINH